MELSFGFFIKSILLGFGLAMDAFSVSLANGLNEPCMNKRRMCFIAGTFAFFQFIMPIIGWICVHTISSHFVLFEKFIPWIALVLLSFIGGKMIAEGRNNSEAECGSGSVGLAGLAVQGIATSIDALSVGFTIAEYGAFSAIISCLVIAAVTFAVCLTGVNIGKKFGTALSGKAGIFGGLILIFIGVEILLKSLV